MTFGILSVGDDTDLSEVPAFVVRTGEGAADSEGVLLW